MPKAVLRGGAMNNPEATNAALQILRIGDNFQWYVIPLLAMVVYVYNNEMSQRRWNVVAAGLCLYGVHWFFEIMNALIQHFSGHALWTVPTGTSFLLLVGVGIELSLMFSIAGIIAARVLPEDPKIKIMGVPNRLFIAVAHAALFSFIEIFLARTPTFIWIYPWWGALPVFVTVYIPFFVIAMYCHDWPPARQRAFVGGLWAVDVAMLVVFAGLLHWI